MAEKKACFLIPVYPPHYHFLEFLNKINENDLSFDIILIISTYEDKRLLLETSYKKIYKVICIEEYISAAFMATLNRNIITFKKFYGLLWLVEKSPIQYDYVAVVDVEINFVNIKNVPEKFQTFIDRKQLLGGSINPENPYQHPMIPIISGVNNVVKGFFKEEDVEILKHKTKNFNLYVWFSDIPIYDMKVVPHFFKYINFSFSNYHQFAYVSEWAFDYVIYAFYLLVKEGYNSIDVRDYGIQRQMSLETAPFSTYWITVEKTKYEPLWVIGNIYRENKEYFKTSSIIMTYHENSPYSYTFGE
jgi:hypothetical protein